MENTSTFFCGEFISNIILFITLLITFFIWINDKRNQKKSYAQIIILQIKNIEKIVIEIQQKGLTNGFLSESFFFNVPILFEKNYWDEYSYILIKDLGEKSYDEIDKFYECCSKIKKYQIEVKENLKQSLGWRGYYYYYYKYSNAFNTDSSEENKLTQDKILDMIEKTTSIQPYIPSEFPKQLTNLLMEYSKISDSVSFQTLKKIADKKTF